MLGEDMDISSATSAPQQLGTAAQVAVQKQSLDGMKQQGAQLEKLLASAGSVNNALQGNFIDAHA